MRNALSTLAGKVGADTTVHWHTTSELYNRGANPYITHLTEHPENLKMLSVKSSELQKSFGKYLEKSLQEPIAVVKYSRPTAYLISATQYEALIENYQRVMRTGKLSDKEVALIQAAQVQTDAPFNLDDLDEDGKLAPSSQQV